MHLNAFYKQKLISSLPSLKIKLIPQHRYAAYTDTRREMDQIEQNQAAMREEIDTIKSKVDQTIETMLALARREDELRNTTMAGNDVPV